MMILLYDTQTREKFPKSFQVQGATGTRTTSILGTTGRSGPLEPLHNRGDVSDSFHRLGCGLLKNASP